MKLERNFPSLNPSPDSQLSEEWNEIFRAHDGDVIETQVKTQLLFSIELLTLR